MSATDLTYAPNRTLRYVEPVACENPFPAMSASQNAQPVAKTISQETAILCGPGELDASSSPGTNTVTDDLSLYLA
ncbi:hypothetical protein HPB50_002481 [Hyalomma asiaticum]|uniref:Uncharacterized protein n=1 Tax=Hyalomma asiaticum TaxID=266040 RepID=A0ACB7SJA3_HYAAI|nr:hypothetical protein HPB50_002481 [Hyalomma asiaticum]